MELNMTENITEDTMATIETADLYFAAFLQTKGCTMQTAKKNNNRTVFFFQVPTEFSRTYRDSYFNNDESLTTQVSACKYANALKNLKTLCYVVKDNK